MENGRLARALYSLGPAYETVDAAIGGQRARITVVVPWERAVAWRRERATRHASELLHALAEDPDRQLL
ncbi:MAG: hypothetical protein JWR77_2424 [Rhizorhabdus sp.]|nr:hypothetical protein [Rhizorhabdus sp.]